MYEAHIEHDHVTRQVKVWLWFDEMTGKRHFLKSLGGDLWQETHIAEQGEIVEPTVVFHPKAFEALIKAGSKVMPPTEATVEHLRDAVSVRDRLLTMIEHEWGVKVGN